jgi:hypothetical protein
MNAKHWKVYAIALFIFILETTATSWASAPVIEWSRTYGGSGSGGANAIQQTNDGGFIVVGSSNSDDGDVSLNRGGNDGWVVRLDAAGDIIWQRTFGGSSNDFFSAVQQTADGGSIIAGCSRSNDGDVSENRGDFDGWVVKLDGNGEIEWQRSLGGSDNDVFRSVRQTMDGGYIVAGASESSDGDVSSNRGRIYFWIVKLDATGNLVWEKSLGGSKRDVATSIRQTSDGGYIVAGFSESGDDDVPGNRGESDIWIVKLNYESPARQ